MQEDVECFGPKGTVWEVWNGPYSWCTEQRRDQRRQCPLHCGEYQCCRYVHLSLSLSLSLSDCQSMSPFKCSSWTLCCSCCLYSAYKNLMCLLLLLYTLISWTFSCGHFHVLQLQLSRQPCGLSSGAWQSWWTILKSKRRSVLNWTTLLARATWSQSQTLTTTNCHISLLLWKRLWGFTWQSHSSCPTWISTMPSLQDMTFQLRAKSWWMHGGLQTTPNTGTNQRSSCQSVSWMQTLRLMAMISVFFPLELDDALAQESSSPFHCFPLCLDAWCSHSNFFLLQVWSR